MNAALFLAAVAMSASLASAANSPLVEPVLKGWGLRALPYIGGRAGASWSAAGETQIFAYNVSQPNAVGMTTYFWMEAGRGGNGRHFTDTSILRHYVDGEETASVVGSVSMLAGSGVGLENASYYTLNQSATPRGSTECVNDANGAQDQCGIDMLDGWPWQTKWTGKVHADSEVLVLLVLLVLTCCSCCCSSACYCQLTRLLLSAGRLGGQLDPAPAHPLHVVAAGDAAGRALRRRQRHQRRRLLHYPRRRGAGGAAQRGTRRGRAQPAPELR